jgi:hypothetical protein
MQFRDEMKHLGRAINALVIPGDRRIPHTGGPMARFLAPLIVGVLVSWWAAGYAADLPSNRAGVPARAVDVKDTFGYRLPAVATEGNFLERYRHLYIEPRAFPESKINTAARYREYLKLRKRREALKLPHINSGFAAGPQAGNGPAGESPGGRGSNGLAWRSVGPTNVNGRVTNIAVDPNNNSRIFVATVGGVWRSVDGARTWQCITDAFLSQVFASVAVDPDESEIIAGTGNPIYESPGGIGIWRSTSNGDPGTWVEVSPPALDNQVIYRLRYDPAPPHDIYAATSAGVWLGTHTAIGISWTTLGGFDANVTDIAVDFSVTPRLVYAGVFSPSINYAIGLWKYDGTQWNERDSGIPIANASVWALGMSANTPGTLYAKVSQKDGHLLDVYKTTTSAEAFGSTNGWTGLGATSLDDSCAGTFCYSWYNSIIEVDPTDANTVYAGGLSPWVTRNGGTGWTIANAGTDPSYVHYVHADHHAFAFDPTNHNIVYAGDDGGIFRSTDTSSPWHWNDVSHGMVITQFYHGTISQAAATLFAGGSQDNGTELTFGNRTWYAPGGCDGSDVAIDSADTDTLYANCNGDLNEFANPVPGTIGGGSQITFSVPSTISLTSPLVTNATVAHFALAAAKDALGRYYVAQTSDGITWGQSTVLPGGSVTALATAPGATSTIYVGLNTPTIVHSINGGGTWVAASSGLPSNLQPNAITVDFTNPSRAIAVFGGSSGAGAYITVDGGTMWIDITGGGTTLLPNVPLTGVAIDPSNPNVIYVASTLGVFKGTISGSPPTVAWAPFDEGIPDGLDVNDIGVNRATMTLSIASFGHGSYERDINPADSGGQAITVVRDVVSDTGIGASSSSGLPDPEHPISDPARPGFYIPNNSPGGLLYWWMSPDIRVDVPALDYVANQIPFADSVEMETCPTEITDCPPGTMIDSNPEPGQLANVYVQVANAGLQPASNVRVIAIYADATVTVPPLPATFWSTTFPAGSTACGALDTSTGWNVPDPSNPCVTIPVVNPEYPQTAKFPWSVPANQAEHSCMLVIIESQDDPIPAIVRSSNVVQSWELVPQNHQIAQRNLHIVTSPAPGSPATGSEGMNVRNWTREPMVQLVFDRSLLPKGATLSVFLPTGAGKRTRGLKNARVARAAVVDARTARYADRHHIDMKTEYRVDANVAELPAFPVAPGQTAGLILRYSSGPLKANTAARFTVLQKSGGKVLGGSTFVLRSAAADYARRRTDLRRTRKSQ